MTVLLAIMVVLSSVFSYTLAAYLTYPLKTRLSIRMHIFWTALLGTLLSVVVATLMLASIWPPISIASWVVWLAFAGMLLLLALGGNGVRRAGEHRGEDADDDRPDLRSDYGV